MRAGQLRHRIVFERKPATLSGLGHAKAPWQAITQSIPAEVNDLTGRELELAKKLHGEVSVSVETRYVRGNVSDRIRQGERVLYVAAVKVNGRRTSAIYLCTEHLD